MAAITPLKEQGDAMLWKRWFDRVVTLIGLPAISWLLGGIALAILLFDGRPVLFRQQRLGRGKQPFEIYKFRTMRDGKVTAVGRVLRQTGLDETAQIINILRGEMSVVGPRPLTAADISRLGWDDAWHAGRWEIKPGITGLAQLYGGRGAKISWLMDKVYRQRLSPWLDLGILLLTFAVNILGKTRVRQLLQHASSTRTFRPVSADSQ